MKMPAITPKHHATRHVPAPDAAVPGPDHGHAHDHDHPHDHGHTHDHAEARASGARRLPPSLLRMSLVGRLGLAVGLSVVIWAAVVWAVAPIAG